MVLLLVPVCCDTAQVLAFLLVSVCCDTAQALVFLLVSVCCDSPPSLGVLAGVSVLWHSPNLGILAGVSVLWHIPNLGVLAGVSVLWHSQALVFLLVSVCCELGLVFLLVSVCCDTAQALVFLLVSLCCDTDQTLVFLLVSLCCDTAQIWVFLLVSVCCDTAQTLVFLLVSVCCDTAKALCQCVVTQPKPWCFCWCQCVDSFIWLFTVIVFWLLLYVHVHVLPGSGGTDHPAGEHSYPFCLLLGASLPSSFEGRRGYVRYFCKASINRPWKFDEHTKRAFTVIHPLDLNMVPTAGVSWCGLLNWSSPSWTQVTKHAAPYHSPPPPPPPKGGRGYLMSSTLSEISGLSFESLFLSPFFCFLPSPLGFFSCHFSVNGPFIFLFFSPETLKNVLLKSWGFFVWLLLSS